MIPSYDEKIPPHLNSLVLSAIQAALKEEREPKPRRVLKILGATLGCASILGIPFVLSFSGQLNFAWGIALSLWLIYLFGGFTLYFRPQARLMIAGVWSPYIIARLLLVATLSTILQILVCPSFVFLSSPLGWNPLLPLTRALMGIGGMNLCMLFCGAFFALISSLISLSLVRKVTQGSIRSSLPAIVILLCSQFPVLAVQALSYDLRTYLLPWISGLLAGSVLGLCIVRMITVSERR